MTINEVAFDQLQSNEELILMLLLIYWEETNPVPGFQPCSCFNHCVLQMMDLGVSFPIVPFLTGGGPTSVLVPGAAAQRRIPGGWRGGELAKRPGARAHQTPQPADAQQAAGTQALAHHTAAHPGQPRTRTPSSRDEIAADGNNRIE